MNIGSTLRNAAPVAGVLNLVVLAAGCRVLLELRRERVRREREERAADRQSPMVVVSADYSRPDEVGLVVGNFGGAPAKDVSFGFSAPIEGPGGEVLSELPFFREGLPFLAPEGRVDCRWGSLPSLVAMLKEKGLEGGVRVTARYRTLAGEPRETESTVNPLLLEGAPVRASRGPDDRPGTAAEPSAREAADGTGEPRPAVGESRRSGTPVRRRRR